MHVSDRDTKVLLLLFLDFNQLIGLICCPVIWLFYDLFHLRRRKWRKRDKDQKNSFQRTRSEITLYSKLDNGFSLLVMVALGHIFSEQSLWSSFCFSLQNKLNRNFVRSLISWGCLDSRLGQGDLLHLCFPRNDCSIFFFFLLS